MKTDQNRIAAGMLAEFEQELGTTRTFLERIPADKLGWKPHEKSMTLGQLALHIAQVPGAVLEKAVQESFAAPDFTNRQAATTPPQLLAELDRSADVVRKLLPGVSDPQMNAELRVTKDGKTLFALPRVAFLRSIMLNHWYHHRGQLGVYLRLVGASVPSSYGPSGDESPFGA